MCPVVIAGCGRSGTSLLLSVLSCHPDLQAIPNETLALTKTPLELGGFPSGRWVEKTPSNVHNIPAILAGIPTARVIHIVRDGRDVITSRHPLQKGRYVSTERWVNDVSAGAGCEHLERVTVVRYRDLVRDYERTMRRLCDFLDLTFAQEFMHYPRTATVQRHPAWKGPARPLSVSSVDRWKRPRWSGYVAEFMANPRAVGLLRRYGFEV